MLNGNPSLSDVDLPRQTDEQVAFFTSHSHYALQNVEPDSWHLVRIEKNVPQVTHSLTMRGSEWVASPVDRGRSVHSPGWRDALRRVVT